jgi:hypothetical protein
MTFKDMKTSLKPGGIIIHKVDLKSHKLDRYRDLDFLTWPSILYRLMYSNKGLPNRYRIDKYKKLINEYGFKCIKLIPSTKISKEKIDAVRPYLSAPFRNLQTEDLAWLNFWMILEHA